ncbi:MAG: chain-length determining protein [Deltaproteobacteria bacterium]|nr:chain-length determining protein [Deltaproteobacteria bacterium]
MEQQAVTVNNYMEPKAKTINDYLDIAKRRKWSLIIPAVVVFIGACIVARVLPSIYKSTATILIVEQDVPVDFVRTTVTSYAEQRLQTIYQRIMSFSRLKEMIDSFELYPDLKKKWGLEQIVTKMREDITLELTGGDVLGKSSRRRDENAVAFAISYQGKDPMAVQQVVGKISYLFLDENIRVREKQASDTLQFLKREMDRISENLAELDAKMAVLKREHINELPGLLQSNLQNLNNIERDIERLNEQLLTLKEKEGDLQVRLAGVSRNIEDRETNNTRLEELKMQLVRLQSRFSDQYPDVVTTKTEIAKFEKQLKDSADTSDELRHSDNTPDNPAYITLTSQLSGIQTDIVSVKRQIKEAYKMAAIYRQRIENTPKVEETYNAILTQRNNTQAKHDDLMRKHMEAKVAQGLEREQKGEHFTLIEPPRFPGKPFKPNRLKILLIGFVMAIGSGVGWTFLREMNDHSIRDSESLVLATSFPVLASIPEIVTEEDIRRQKKKQILIVIALVLGMVAGVTAFHYLVMDLNVFWAKLMRKIVF